MDSERTLSSYNLPFLEGLYEQYERDPDSVDPQWRAFLEQPPGWLREGNGHAHAAASDSTTRDAQQVVLQARVDKLIEHYRLHGHLGAHLDPLERPRRETTPALDPAYFGLEREHLDVAFDPGTLFRERSVTLREIIGRLQRTYCRHIGVEYWGIKDLEQRTWLQERMESCENEVIPSHDEQLHLLRALAHVDSVDKFLHSKFIGAKRFSISGAESVIAVLETMLEEGSELGLEEIVIGMAHRGRLNVLMNILGKTPADIFSEFESGDPWANLGSGDVKYHKGSYRNLVTRHGKAMYVALAFNPSHLEAITPVIAGRIRSKQDYWGDADGSRVMGVTIHGDAAIPGQGVFAETLNLSRLPGYQSGGSIRIVINNQIGFTTNPDEGRSTVYATAVADGLNVPIFHINGDDPEAAAYVARLAVAFRQRFKRDVLIDMICYRRFGHNEGDEPTFTQPMMYQRIAAHASVRETYQRKLIERGRVSEEDCARIDEELREAFETALQEIRRQPPPKGRAPMHGIWEKYLGGPEKEAGDVETRVTNAEVEPVHKAMTTIPEGFSVHPKIARFIDELGAMYRGEAPLSWAAAEHLAYGTLLLSGHDVRLSGQDTIRGTFSHRHAAWADIKDGTRYFPLQHLEGKSGRFTAYNSPLSEFAVLGFEFGYSIAAPHALVVWEAQFGDFANGGQVIIDQFLSSSEDKWNRISGLTLMLPHGFEGQGPEHSSARLERFLQLCAEDNMQVCNLTTSGQMFHVLRRQMLRRWRKPLIIMTPKSLLRAKESFTPLESFLRDPFQRVIDDAVAQADQVQRVMLCSGKIYYDLLRARTQSKSDKVAVVRVEQLYPFAGDQLTKILARYHNAKELLWVQEEPKNMGAWTFMRSNFDELSNVSLRPVFVGRPESASPATGSPDSHKLEQDLILQDAFKDLD